MEPNDHLPEDEFDFELPKGIKGEDDITNDIK